MKISRKITLTIVLTLLLLLTYGAFFRGDVRLNGFELVTLICVCGKGAQQYASANHAGVDQGPD